MQEAKTMNEYIELIELGGQALVLDVLEYAGGFFWLDLKEAEDFRAVRIFFRNNPDADIMDIIGCCEENGIPWGTIRNPRFVIPAD